MKKVFIAALIFCTGLFMAGYIFAASDSVRVDVIIEGCNNNGVCEAVIGEDSLSCPLDCDVATTTPPTPPAPDPGRPRGGGMSTFQIYELTVLPGTNSAVITWKTSRPAITQLWWGNSAEVGSGVMTETSYFTEHSVILEDLSPATVYYFTIQGSDVNGWSVELPLWSFRTHPAYVSTQPSNVMAFTATPLPEYIYLEWRMPYDPSADFVRLMRSTTGYPASPFEGDLVFEGTGTSYRDRDVTAGITYYYSIFVKDTNGVYSSGALARAAYTGSQIKDPLDGTPGTGIDVGPKIPDYIHPSILSLRTDDFRVIQNEELAGFYNGEARLTPDDPYSVYVDYSYLPERFGLLMFSIMINGTSHSYILSPDADRMVYSATIDPLGMEGVFSATVDVANRDGAVLKSVSGTIISEKIIGEREERISNSFVLLLLLVLILAMFLFLLVIVKRRKEEEERVGDER